LALARRARHLTICVLLIWYVIVLIACGPWNWQGSSDMEGRLLQHALRLKKSWNKFHRTIRQSSADALEGILIRKDCEGLADR
jgi:outer membrane lipopolysaccharide assembly protein LptE/RlpB